MPAKAMGPVDTLPCIQRFRGHGPLLQDRPFDHAGGHTWAILATAIDPVETCTTTPYAPPSALSYSAIASRATRKASTPAGIPQ